MPKVLGNVVSTILLRSALPSLEQNFSDVQLGLFELGQRYKFGFSVLVEVSLGSLGSSSSGSSSECLLLLLFLLLLLLLPVCL